jgi:hypothetical protein
MISRLHGTEGRLLPYFFVLVAVLIIVLLLRWRHIRKAETTVDVDSLSDTAKMRSPFHAVSVRVGRKACMAVKTVEGQRFLAVEAPQLPLAECSNAEDCECRFIHHEDRRSGHDRRSPYSPGSVGTGTGTMEAERRQGGDRRRADPQDGAAGS